MNSRNEALRSLIYAAEQAQRATGLVTTSSLVQPTPVAFYSTTKGTPEPFRNAIDLLYSGIDVVLGGGEQYFTPANADQRMGPARRAQPARRGQGTRLHVVRARGTS